MEVGQGPRGVPCARGSKWRVELKMIMEHCVPPSGGQDEMTCHACLDEARLTIRAVGRDYLDLGKVIGEKSGGHSEPVTGSRDKTIPINVNVDELQRLIHGELVMWEEIVLDRLSLPGQSDKVRPLVAVGRATGLLHRAVERLATPEGVLVWDTKRSCGYVWRSGLEAIQGLDALHRRAMTILGLTVKKEKLPGSCPACGMAWLERETGKDNALTRESGQDYVKCGICGSSFDELTYTRHISMLTGGASL